MLLMRNGSMMVLASMASLLCSCGLQIMLADLHGKRSDSGHRMGTVESLLFLGGAQPHRVVGQFVGLAIVLAADVRDGKINRARQLAAGPIQGVKTRAAAGVLARHLLDHDLRVGINAKGASVDRDGVLQGLEQRNVLGHVVVLVPDPSCNAGRFAVESSDHDSNTRRPGIPVRATVHIGYQIGHRIPYLTRCYTAARFVKRQGWFVYRRKFCMISVKNM